MKLIMLCLCMALTSCATTGPRDQPFESSSRIILQAAPKPAAPEDIEEVSGVFYSNFKEHCFMPDGVDEAWWVLANEDLLDRYKRVAKVSDEMYAHVHVKLKGLMSKRGLYGHMNMYDREFRVTELLELRPLSEVSQWK